MLASYFYSISYPALTLKSRRLYDIVELSIIKCLVLVIWQNLITVNATATLVRSTSCLNYCNFVVAYLQSMSHDGFNPSFIHLFRLFI